MNYGFTEVDFAMAPVDLCYLISTTDASGNRVQNGYQYAMGVVTDYIISFLAKEQSGFTLESHITNLNSIKEGIRVQHGASVDYNILGASVGMLLEYVGFFAGYTQIGMSSMTVRLTMGCVISVLVLLVIQFFFFNLDYTRTERVQFEDDEYYYYVKAVPKRYVPARAKTVKKISENTRNRKSSHNRVTRRELMDDLDIEDEDR